MKEVYPGKKPQKEAQIIVDIGLFDAFLLKTSSGLENALSVLETRVSAPGLDLTTFLEELMAVPKLFEFLVSVTSEVAENHGSASDTSSSFAQMSAKKTSLLAQYTEDFGERRILASSRLIRNLKQARNKHPKLFDRIVVKLGWARK
ncbi:hypothetical protein PHLCEN_2v8158 [Hermanssonia centrifuga]|uniref:Uncharacterized protein n=1 Tax=Hermanssonia centrifuga TaxID=98765 RepID=A0A2R6NUF8_9APHY|nr:hypothetical protein PHLCEN_2v8158 [Hermanssonia centrifuga]